MQTVTFELTKGDYESWCSTKLSKSAENQLGQAKKKVMEKLKKAGDFTLPDIGTCVAIRMPVDGKDTFDVMSDLKTKTGLKITVQVDDKNCYANPVIAEAVRALLYVMYGCRNKCTTTDCVECADLMTPEKAKYAKTLTRMDYIAELINADKETMKKVDDGESIVIKGTSEVKHKRKREPTVEPEMPTSENPSPNLAKLVKTIEEKNADSPDIVID